MGGGAARVIVWRDGSSETELDGDDVNETEWLAALAGTRDTESEVEK